MADKHGKRKCEKMNIWVHLWRIMVISTSDEDLLLTTDLDTVDGGS